VTFTAFKIQNNLDIAAYSHDARATERIAAELFEAHQIRAKRRAELEQHLGEGSCGPRGDDTERSPAPTPSNAVRFT
jgi:hypothetical protein